MPCYLMQKSQRANSGFLLIKTGISLHEMCKRKKIRFKLNRASDKKRRQRHSWPDKTSFYKQNIILWKLDSNFGRVGSCQNT